MKEKQKANILYLDDDKENLDGFRLTFKRDYKILTTTSPKEALKLLEEQSIQLVIADQRMPEVSGAEFLARVVELYPDTMRILLTGYSDMDAIVEAINKGRIFHYLTKPWQYDEIKHVINNALEVYHLKMENKHLLESMKELNRELYTAKAKAEEADRLKTAFLANMSHEIRTPLNSIMGFTHLLVYEEISQDKRESFFNVVKRSAEELACIIDDILDISRIEVGQLEVYEETIHLKSFLEDVFTIIENDHLRKEKERVKWQFLFDEEDKDIEIVSDSVRLKQIIMNLVNNAFKFTDEGHVVLSAAIKKSEADKRLIIRIEDTGVGIAPERFDYIFKRFNKIENKQDKLYRGNGLGLPIARDLTHLLGGEISVSSTEGKGATFTVELPYKAPLKQMVTGKVTQLFYDWDDKTILIVEDDPNNFLMLEQYLLRTQVHVVHAESGEKAISYCQSIPDIDLVIMDIGLPLMDGYQATKLIKQHRNNLPVIAHTAYVMDQDREKCLDAGCDDFIPKPFEANELFEKIDRFLS